FVDPWGLKANADQPERGHEKSCQHQAVADSLDFEPLFGLPLALLPLGGVVLLLEARIGVEPIFEVPVAVNAVAHLLLEGAQLAHEGSAEAGFGRVRYRDESQKCKQSDRGRPSHSLIKDCKTGASRAGREIDDLSDV